MKLTEIRKAGTGNNNGFNFYGKVIETGKTITVKEEGAEVKKPALLVEQISGREPGRQLLIAMRTDPSYGGKDFDADGLTALRIKKGATIGMDGGHYVSKGEGDELPIVEVRRATKVGKDFRAEQSLAISSYGASMKNLSGYLLTPKGGVHDVLEGENKDIKSLINKAYKNATEDQGLMVVASVEVDGKPVTMHRVINRYTYENNASRKLSNDEFEKSIDAFLEKGSLITFAGLASGALKDVLTENKVQIAVVPAERTPMTGEKYLDNGSRAINAGIGRVGVGVDPANDERAYQIIQTGAMEMTGLVGFRTKDENKQYVGDKVRQQPDQMIMSRLIGQIDMLNGVELAARNTTNATQTTTTEPAPAEQATPEPAAPEPAMPEPEAHYNESPEDFSSNNDYDPFDFDTDEESMSV